MRRRDFLIGAAAAFALPRRALAQATGMPRVAVLSLPLLPSSERAIHEGLADFGYVDGKNVSVGLFTAATWKELPKAAMAAAASRPDIILTQGTAASHAAADATATIPIVFAGLLDPVGTGLISNRGRPGGNMTGTTLLTADLIGRQLTMAKQIIPDVRRVAVLSIAGDAPSAIFADQVVDAGTQLDLDPGVVHFVPGEDFAAEFRRVIAFSAQAVYLPASGYFGTNAAALVELQAMHRVPIIATSVSEGQTPAFAGVFAFGAAVAPAIRQAGSFVDAILRGTKPGDLAVKLPTVFDFAVDVRAATALGLEVRPSILSDATLVVR